MKSDNAPQPSAQNACRLNCAKFGLFPFRSPLLGEYLRFLFLEVLRCFTSLGIATMTYEFSHGSYGITRKGLPHSEIFGSTPVCDSPKHIAAYHVLHRLLTPSHPPQTLRSLTLLSFSRANCPSLFMTDCIGLLKIYVLPYIQLSKNKKFIKKFLNFYGPERGRTADLLNANQALYPRH